ncbi:Uncharacterised protein [Mycobacterium tuberculosis]|nr:Uncharacterised protein [Mycobacterium tuberculosis]CKV08954.1 Uncharacterised protein [Mycobacterium tuberculosis]
MVELREATISALRITIGTIGIFAAMAIRKGPFLNDPTSVVSNRVPSGAITIDSPLRARSSTVCSVSTAATGSSRSMNTPSSNFPSVPMIGSLASSFLPTPTQLSRTSAPAMTGSTWLRWLKIKTAGRWAVRFSFPITFRCTPLVASSS